MPWFFSCVCSAILFLPVASAQVCGDGKCEGFESNMAGNWYCPDDCDGTEPCGGQRGMTAQQCSALPCPGGARCRLHAVFDQCYCYLDGGSGVAQCSDALDNDSDGEIDALVTSQGGGGTTIGNGNPFGGVRSFVNQHAAEFGYRTIPDTAAVHNDATTAQKVCQIAGYTQVVSVECEAPAYENRCGYASFENNGMYRWDGSDFVSIRDNVWISSITCSGSVTDCSDGRDNDGDGGVDMNDDGCVTTQDTKETKHDAQCVSADDPVEGLAECKDEKDNDGDGKTDFAGDDPGCENGDDNDERDRDNGCPQEHPQCGKEVLNAGEQLCPGQVLEWGNGNCKMETGDAGRCFECKDFGQCPADFNHCGNVETAQCPEGENVVWSDAGEQCDGGRCYSCVADRRCLRLPHHCADCSETADSCGPCPDGSEPSPTPFPGCAGDDDPPICPIDCKADADCGSEMRCTPNQDDPSKPGCWLDAGSGLCVKQCLVPRCIDNKCELATPPEGAPGHPYVPCEAAQCPAPRCGDGIVQGNGADAVPDDGLGGGGENPERPAPVRPPPDDDPSPPTSGTNQPSKAPTVATCDDTMRYASRIVSGILTKHHDPKRMYGPIDGRTAQFSFVYGSSGPSGVLGFPPGVVIRNGPGVDAVFSLVLPDLREGIFTRRFSLSLSDDNAEYRDLGEYEPADFGPRTAESARQTSFSIDIDLETVNLDRARFVRIDEHVSTQTPAIDSIEILHQECEQSGASSPACPGGYASGGVPTQSRPRCGSSGWLREDARGVCSCVYATLPGPASDDVIASLLADLDGDGDPDEECDDGNNVGDDGCSPTCKKEMCGDGAVQQKGADGKQNTLDDEECDDGNIIGGDGCSPLCKAETCGDGVRDQGEECDDGDENSDTEPSACRTNCMRPKCNDGVVDDVAPYREQCDCGEEGAAILQSVIDAAGQPIAPMPFCTTTLKDGTKAACAVFDCHAEYCGDGGQFNTGPDLKSGTADDERCDDGERNTDEGVLSGCRTDCKYSRCGDGVVDTPAGETCDEGQAMFRCAVPPNDPCTCGIPSWGGNPPLGNPLDQTCCGGSVLCIPHNTPTCPSNCGVTHSTCGNARIERDEECDITETKKLFLFRPNRDGGKLSFIEDNGLWGVVPVSIEKKYTTVDHAPHAGASPDNAYMRSKKQGLAVTYFHLWDVITTAGYAQSIVARIGVDFSGKGTDWRIVEAPMTFVSNQPISIVEMNGAILAVEGDEALHTVYLTLYNPTTGRQLTNKTTIDSPIVVNGTQNIDIDAIELLVEANMSADGKACTAQCILKRCGNTVEDTDIGETCDDGDAESGDGCSDRCEDEICALPPK